MSLVTAEDAADRTRPLLTKLVDARFLETRSRTVAIEDVAAEVGRSASWLRKVFATTAPVLIGLHDGMNIAAAYDRLCSRIEAAAETEKARAAALRRSTDAAVSSTLDLVDGKARAPRGGTGVRFLRAPAAPKPARRGAREAALHLNCPALGRV